MGATFSRVKTWNSTEDVTNTDLNAEFDNILNNLDPAGIDDYSTNTTQMQSTVDPGELGSESLAGSLAGEIERLRFMLGELKDGSATNWYESITTNLSQITVPSLNQYTYVNFLSGSTTNSINGPLIAANTKIEALIIKPTTAFAGGSISSYLIDVGISGDADKYIDAFEMTDSVADTNYLHVAINASVFSSTQLTITATSTGDNLNSATAGAFNLWLLTQTLPAS